MIPENRESFQKRLVALSETDQKLIDFAYDIAKESHRPQQRDGGERYFEHVRAVAIVLMDECKLIEPDLIIAALLHDSIEDSATFGNAKLAYTFWKAVARFRIAKAFNEHVAQIVITLTKPKVDGDEINTKEQSREIYFQNLRKAEPDALLIKMCDRLHNLRSLAGTTQEKRDRIIKETEEIYYPLLEESLENPVYQKERKYLFDEIKREVNKSKRYN